MHRSSGTANASISPSRMSAPETLQLSVDDPRWLRFVESRREAGTFHHPAWAGFLAEMYGYRAFALLVDGRQGMPLIEVRSPFRKRSWISLPFTDSCAPLADDEDRLAHALDEERARAGVPTVELRGAIAGARARTAGYLHRLELARDPDTVFRRFHRGQVQRGIRKAGKEDLSVRRATVEQDVTDVFYPLFVGTRQRLGVPVQERRFFELLWRRVLEPGLGTTLLVFQGSTPVAGGIFLSWNGTTIYKYGASDAQAWKLRPNHRLFWEAISDACLRGDRIFDFGRTDLENEGLRQFKAGWGTEELELTYSTIGAAATKHGGGRGVRAAGVVIRRSPRWVGRAAGKLLYKYAT
jgi:CelD/BcsL family acetyltransferase involved in cellulose biosynthesis